MSEGAPEREQQARGPLGYAGGVCGAVGDAPHMHTPETTIAAMITGVGSQLSRNASTSLSRQSGPCAAGEKEKEKLRVGQ